MQINISHMYSNGCYKRVLTYIHTCIHMCIQLSRQIDTIYKNGNHQRRRLEAGEGEITLPQ